MNPPDNHLVVEVCCECGVPIKWFRGEWYHLSVPATIHQPEPSPVGKVVSNGMAKTGFQPDEGAERATGEGE